jgi:hypothetical protein
MERLVVSIFWNSNAITMTAGRNCEEIHRARKVFENG